MYSYKVKCYDILPPLIKITLFKPPPGCNFSTYEINNYNSTLLNTHKSSIDKYNDTYYRKTDLPFEYKYNFENNNAIPPP